MWLPSFRTIAATSAATEAVDDNDGGPATKSPRVSPDVVWEWEGDGGWWSQYSRPHADEITDALVSGEEEVTLQITPAVKMKIRFSAMTQMNVATGWQRNVRCLPQKVATSMTGLWEFQENPTDPWTAYAAPVQRWLEACFLCGVGSLARVEALTGKWFKLDFGKMKQVSEETGKEWTVQRSDPIGELEAGYMASVV